MEQTTWIAAGAALAVVFALWWLVMRRKAQAALAEAERKAQELVEKARREADAKLREADVAAKEKLLQARTEFEKVSRKRRSELEAQEQRIVQREDKFDRRLEEVRLREKEVEGRERALSKTERRLESKREELATAIEEQRTRLEQIAGLTAQQATEELRRSLEHEARLDAAHLVKRVEDEAREKAEREAQRIIGTAIQRSASDYIAETTVSVVHLPSDDMKGRVIGREGRNIRALELATGVDLIVDDTPEAVILSGFDPYRREIARVSLERLVKDGRIHPARIEEVVEKVKVDVEKRVRHPQEPILILGHPVRQQVAFLAATMAGELKSNVPIAKRAGLFHDVGKAVDRELEGTHVELGIDLLRKYGESEEVIHGMACHHGDYEPETVEAVLVTAADALSAARPGARREVLETYVKRLEKLEEIARAFKGVQKSYAIQAGREVRVIADCKRVSDEEAIWLSKDIAKKVEAELTYPGQIKITVIRENRAVEYAK